ncbi:MAG: FtsQ-type POTRA domain-containing protein [Actinobacteria bacterium]|nr:FtsQ-type POTRA domain-containing protein [Actinomycetota bacterium]
MRDKSAGNRGAEVRVSRAKSRVVAKRKAALQAHSQRRVKNASARRKPGAPQAEEGHARHDTEVKTAGKKRRPVPTREKRKIQAGGKNERKADMREPGATARALKADARREKRLGVGKTAQARVTAAPGVGVEATGRGAGEAPEAKEKKNKAARVSAPARILMLGTLLVLALAALLWVYTFTGVLNVTEVEVRGNEVLSEGYLRTLSGITRNTHLLKMNVKAVESALLSEAYVAGVDVSRHFPNKVVLEITERKPTGFIVQNGKYNLVDQEGMILESVDAVAPGLVEIKDMEMQLLLPGEEIGGADFATVTSLLGSMPSALREITTAVGMREGEGLYLEGKGTTVIYGEASELSRKNTIALLALTGLVDRYGAVEYIDISFPDHPVIKPAGAG